MTGTRKATTAPATDKQPRDPAIRQAAHQTAVDCQKYATQLRRKLQEANR